MQLLDQIGRWRIVDSFGVEWALTLDLHPSARSDTFATVAMIRRLVDDALAPWGEGRPDLANVLLAIASRVSGDGFGRLVSFRFGRTSGWKDTHERVSEALERAVRFGRLRVERIEAPLPLLVDDDDAPDTQPEPPPPDDEGKSWFEVSVVDEVGMPVDGIELAFGFGGDRRIVTTDGRGVARVDDIDGSTGSVRIASVAAVREKLAPRWDAGPRSGDPPAGPNTQVVPLGSKVDPVRIESETPATIVVVRAIHRARLVGFYFDTDKCFLLPRAMSGIRAVARMYAVHPDAELLVIGHTDTAGSSRYNEQVSLERARSVAAYLTDDVDAWTAWFEPTVPAAKRWGTLEVQHMLSALPGESEAFYAQPTPSGKKDAATREAIKRFQSWSNDSQGTTLSVDGNAGKETRAALVRAYMALDGTSLPAGVAIRAVGAGEAYPRVPSADGVENPDNRRVEVLVFEDGVHPPPPGDIVPPGSPAYAAWTAQVVDTLDVEHQGVHIYVVDEAGARIGGARVTLLGPHSDSATADASGGVVFVGLPAGSYKVQAEKDGYTFGEAAFTYPPRSDERRDLPVTSAPKPRAMKLHDGPDVLALDARTEPSVGDGDGGAADVVVVLQAETVVVVNVRDMTEALLPGVTVTVVPSPGITIVGAASVVSDNTGRAEFKVSGPGTVTVQAKATPPFEAASAVVPATDKATTMTTLRLDTRFEPKHRFQWQNRLVRDEIYPERDKALRQFLVIDKTLDLLSTPKSADELKVLEASLAGKSHKELLLATLDRFAADTKGRWSSWVRYMVLHFSGMKYDSAHSSHGDPAMLPSFLLRAELEEWLADPARVPASRLRELAQEARARAEKDPKSYPPKKVPSPNPGTLANATDAQLADPKTRAKLCAHVVAFFELTAQMRQNVLSLPQALGVLRARSPNGAFGAHCLSSDEWVKVVSKTQLRLDASSIEEVRGANPKPPPKPREPAPKPTNRESAIQTWLKDHILWREYHAEHLGPLVSRAVCDQIATMSMHARGLAPNGGIAADAKFAGENSSAKVLKDTRKREDCFVNAGLFFSRWRTICEDSTLSASANKWRSNDSAMLDVDSPIEGGVNLSETKKLDAKSRPPPQVVELSAKSMPKGAVKLNWSRAPAATAYEVFRSDSETFDMSVPLASAISKESFIDSKAEEGRRFYAVRAVNANGPGKLSRFVAVESDVLAEPKKRPSQLVAKATVTGSVSLSWTPASAGTYEIHGAKGSSVDVEPTTLLGTSKQASFLHVVGIDEMWTYCVVAVNGGARSEPSKPVTVATGLPATETIYTEGDVYTYHLRYFAGLYGPHLELMRTYKGTGKVNEKKEYVGKVTEEEATGRTHPSEPGVMTDVLIWEHEAAIAAIEDAYPGRNVLLTIETGPTGLHAKRRPGSWSTYTAVAERQDLAFAKLEPFLRRADLEKCED